MALRVKRRRKSRRFRGSHTHGRGFKKKARGSGHRGGVGMAGTGKRGDQRKSMILKNTLPEYFGKRQTRMVYGNRFKLKTLNLERLSFDKIKDKADYSDYKVVGVLTQPVKLHITAGAASESAIKSVKKHGGEITVKDK
ncbi:MAG: uL15 family ribosomal protein [Nanoarchaeota archaeon]